MSPYGVIDLVLYAWLVPTHSSLRILSLGKGYGNHRQV